MADETPKVGNQGTYNLQGLYTTPNPDELRNLECTDEGYLIVSMAAGATSSDNKTEDTAHSSGDVGSFILGVRNDANASRISTDGNYGPISTDTSGNVKTVEVTATTINAANHPTRVATSALAASLVIKNAAGILYTVDVLNTNASAQYIQIHNTASLPADASVPVYVFRIPGATSGTIDFEPKGEHFNTGIVICNSSTADTKTIGAADCWFVARRV